MESSFKDLQDQSLLKKEKPKNPLKKSQKRDISWKEDKQASLQHDDTLNDKYEE